MNEILKKTTALTPIDGYDDTGDPSSSRGTRYVKFDGGTATIWFLRETGAPMLPLSPYYAPDIWEELLKWVEKQRADRIRKEPGKELPDVDTLNASCPKNEWAADFNGVLQGPWRHTYNVGLVDISTGSRFIVSNSTIGMRVAFEDLRERVQFMRKLRGRVIPVVELASVQMKTRFGLKLRPDFKILDWRSFDGSAAQAIAGPAGGQLPGSAVAEPTASEIIDDSLPPWNDDISDVVK
jgi:hypothetical protein